MGYWRGYLPGARCRLAYGPADAKLLTVSCFSKIQFGFTFLVPAHSGSPGQRAIKRVCVCVCVVEKLGSVKVEVPEVTQSEMGQKQKLREVLDMVNHLLNLTPSWVDQKWSVDSTLFTVAFRI